MNFFKKALIAILSVGLVTVPAAREVETVEAASNQPTRLYLAPNSNWTQASARFAAYFFGNGEKWISMDYTFGNYSVLTPTDKVYPSVIFCRMNPSTSDNNWNKGVKWNQTGDLTIPTDGKNLFTVKSGTWDGATTAWSNYTQPVYTLIGINGDWATDIEFSEYRETTAEFVAEKVELNAGSSFKVRKDKSWNNSYGIYDSASKVDGKLTNDNDGNLVVPKKGYYDIYFKGNHTIYIEQYYRINFLDSIDDSNYGHYYTLYNDGTFADKEAPTKEGYTFVCWEDEFGNEVTQVTEDDTTLYAKWEPNEYGVTFKVADQTLDKTGTYGESLENVLPTKEELKAKGYNVLAWDKDLSSTITGNTEVTATSYYKYFEAKAELGFGYEYNENGEITSVNNMKARFGSDYVSLDSFVGLDITEYGIHLYKGDKNTGNPYVKTWKYTSELDDKGKPLDNEVGKFTYNSETKEYEGIKDKEEVPTHIRWALTINNIPESYYNGNFTYECFIVVGEKKHIVSNVKTVSVVSLAETYAGMDSIAEGSKKACQYIVDTYAVAA